MKCTKQVNNILLQDVKLVKNERDTLKRVRGAQAKLYSQRFIRNSLMEFSD